MEKLYFSISDQVFSRYIFQQDAIYHRDFHRSIHFTALCIFTIFIGCRKVKKMSEAAQNRL
jgi:hypothetical protein